MDPLLLLICEFVAVGIFTLLAGISPEVAKICAICMVAFWLMWMISDSSGIAKLGDFATSAANASEGK
jgi:hypothetical protein